MAYPKAFLFALLLVAMFMLVSSASTQSANHSVIAAPTNSTNSSGNSSASPTVPTSPSASGDLHSAGTTISSSVALFGALIAAALFSL